VLGGEWFMIYRVSQEERSIFWEIIVLVILSKKKTLYVHVTYSERFPSVSLYSFWIWRPILSSPPAVLRHCLKHVTECEASVGHFLHLQGQALEEDAVNF